MQSPGESTDSRTQPAPPQARQAGFESAADGQTESPSPIASCTEPRDLFWILAGNHGLRVGWSVLFFWIVYRFSLLVLGNVAVGFYSSLPNNDYSLQTMFLGEVISLLALVGAVAFVAQIEHRRILDYNLTGPHRARNFSSGFLAGFLALSALVGALAWGGWLRFGPVALSGRDIFRFGALWGCAFLLVGCFEEGIFRCFLQFTLARGISFWWAVGATTALCLDLFIRSVGSGADRIFFLFLKLLPAAGNNGIFGVYLIAVLGFFPCFYLHRRKAPRSGFWQAAWVTSTLFGYWHTSNPGESWIGIFAAALIGFVFCVSVYVTGSAWWAIGCHAAWDWAETYFYGTPDSGMVSPGHYLSTSPAGNAFWSGGADGPEGSLLVLGVILLLLAALLVIHGRQKPGTAALERAIG
jgi:hypothetical protein